MDLQDEPKMNLMNNDVNTLIDWDKMPDWVNFAAMDYDGGWHGFEKLPMEGHVYWASVSKSVPLKIVPPSSEINWKHTLQERPQ